MDEPRSPKPISENQRAASRLNGRHGGRPRTFNFNPDSMAGVNAATMQYLRPLVNGFGEQQVYDNVLAMLLREYQPQTSVAMDLAAQIARIRSQVHRYDLMLDQAVQVDSSVRLGEISDYPRLRTTLEMVKRGESIHGLDPCVADQLFDRFVEQAVALRKSAKRYVQRDGAGRQGRSVPAKRRNLVELVWPLDHLVELTDRQTLMEILGRRREPLSSEGKAVKFVVERLLELDGQKEWIEAARGSARNVVRHAVEVNRTRLADLAEIQRLRNALLPILDRLERRLIRFKKLGG